MKKILQGLLILVAFAIIPVMAQEPANLAIAKKQLITYHDSGIYEKDIHQAINQAMHYLKKRLAEPTSFQGKKPAIILDIDETALSNYPFLIFRDFGGSVEDIRHDEDLGQDLAITPTLALYRYAKAHQVAVFFLTGRFEAERAITAENLQKVGYRNWDGLFLRAQKDEKVPAAIYKTAVRKQLSQQGYDIILNIGDQYSDLAGGYADKTIKLPNPYYFIP